MSYRDPKYRICKNGRLKIGDWVVGMNSNYPYKLFMGQVRGTGRAQGSECPPTCSLKEYPYVPMQTRVALYCNATYRFDTQEAALAFLLSQ